MKLDYDNCLNFISLWMKTRDVFQILCLIFDLQIQF